MSLLLFYLVAEPLCSLPGPPRLAYQYITTAKHGFCLCLYKQDEVAALVRCHTRPLFRLVLNTYQSLLDLPHPLPFPQ